VHAGERSTVPSCRFRFDVFFSLSENLFFVFIFFSLSLQFWVGEKKYVFVSFLPIRVVTCAGYLTWLFDFVLSVVVFFFVCHVVARAFFRGNVVFF